MDLNEERAGSVTVLQVRGRIDSTSAPVLGERLTAMLGATPAGSWWISAILIDAGCKARGPDDGQVGGLGQGQAALRSGGGLDLFTIVGARDEGVAVVR